MPIRYDVRSYCRVTRVTVPGTRTDFMFFNISVAIGRAKARGFRKALLIRNELMPNYVSP
jgi:hypothetical protein